MTHEQWMRKAMLTLISSIAIQLPDKIADKVGDTLLHLKDTDEKITEKENKK